MGAVESSEQGRDVTPLKCSLLPSGCCRGTAVVCVCWGVGLRGRQSRGQGTWAESTALVQVGDDGGFNQGVRNLFVLF